MVDELTFSVAACYVSTSTVRWAADASRLIGECFDHAKPLIRDDFEGLPPLVRFVAGQLLISCHLSTESALLLIQAGKEWDADLISRSVMEGSTKLAYMLHGSELEIESKADEYWNVLPIFSVIRHAENAKQLLASVSDADAPAWRPFKELLVEQEEIASIRARYSKRDRQVLEERWSFSGICRFFAGASEPGLRHLAQLAHGYSMSSHLIHKDADGVGIAWERSTRDEVRRMAVSDAHSARVVSDACAFAKLRLSSLLRACGKTSTVIAEIESKYSQLDMELVCANSRFNGVEYPTQSQ